MIEGLFDGLHFFFVRDATVVLTDLFDIALVAFLIYRVLVLVKGTRAMQMGVGLAFIFLVYEFARRMGLVTISTILDSLVTYLVLIIVVIFQSDIRRALMRFGRGPLMRPSAGREAHVLEETVKAASSLAQKRIGALIVFERGAALDEFIEPGTELDANVTRELLVSTFIPSYENPIHDGAVIIREGRVWQAGAFLPLTASPQLDRTLGTRHRAAISLSEETDAVILVVSEERGTMSLCVDGNIIRDLDTASLRDALVGLFQRRPKLRGGRKSLRPSMVPEGATDAETATKADAEKAPMVSQKAKET
jgi:uncharacterized protein (TIGR00159 family)